MINNYDFYDFFDVFDCFSWLESTGNDQNIGIKQKMMMFDDL